MLNKEGRVYALLATGRVANVPSVVSNLGVGVLLGFAGEGAGFEWPWLLMVCSVLIYVGANFLNDFWDRGWDEVHRPERALPRGLFPARMYLLVAVGWLVGPVVMSYCYGAGAAVCMWLLVGFVLIYTWVHKRTALSVIPMGLCRAMLPVLGFVGVRGYFDWVVLFPAVGLFLYVAGLSLSARMEGMKVVAGGGLWLGRGLLVGAGVLPAVLAVVSFPGLGWVGVLPFGVLPFGIWLFLCLRMYRETVSSFVSALLAGIALVDWVLMLPISFMWVWMGWSEVGDGLFLCGFLLAPVCFVLGRFLQRVAPAT